MSQEEIEELRKELEQLRVVASGLRSENIELTEFNRILTRRVQNLERSNATGRNTQITATDSQGKTIRVGNPIKMNSPTCPGRNRSVIPEDGIARITRISGEWTCFICASGVRTKRHPSNATLLSQDGHR